MLVRNCAGGLVFRNGKVFLLKNDKSEWVFPKGVLRNNDLPSEVALKRVKEEAGIEAEIISTAGQTSYEFFSVTRQKPVCNRITWYIMKALNDDFQINKDENFLDGGYFPIEKAVQMATYSQDKALLNLSYKNYFNVCTVTA
jgi:8-oxo-dGTP pyrophosphatase MutT (NUDIX family)